MPEPWLYLEIVNASTVAIFGHCSCLNRGYIWKLLMPEPLLYLDIVNALTVVIFGNC